MADVAAQTGADVRAVYVFEPIAEWVSEADPRSWHQAAQRQLDGGWVEPLRAAGVSVDPVIVEDLHPFAALVAAAEEADAGLIVVGTARVGSALGVRLGRVPLQLVHHAQLPVVLVPPGPDHEGPEAVR